MPNLLGILQAKKDVPGNTSLVPCANSLCRIGKTVRKRRSMSMFLGCSEGQKERTWKHKARAT